MAETKDLFTRLKKMFSTDVIVRNVGGKKLKIIDTDEIQYATDRNSLRDRFNRLRSSTYNLHNRDMSMAYQASRLELFRDYDCIGPDTVIPLPDGTRPTIKELTEKYNGQPRKKFPVFSYDHETDSIKIGMAYHPRKKGHRMEGFKVTFDNGQCVIGSEKHPFLMRNGEYKMIKELTLGEAVMPFYRKDDKIKVICNENKSKIDSTLNHKIVSIEPIGELDVYDVTVEKYHNFATDSCFVKNTMDMDPIIASALDIYSDESTTLSEFGQVLTIRSENENIKKILENLFYDILNVEFNLWSWTRNLCKYGDFFLRLEISPEYGVFLVHPIGPYEITRIEGSDPKNVNYVKYQHDGMGGGMEYENFEIAHFRLLSDSNFLPYGKCLTGHTFIDTEFGSIKIKDIKVGERVWTMNLDSKKPELANVVAQVSSGKKEILRLRTQHNFIDSSKNHPILIYNTGTKLLEYKNADEIKIGDLLLISSNKNKLDRSIKIDKTVSEDITCKSFIPEEDNIPNFINEEFANFFGFMLGDGWIKKYNTGCRVCFALGIDEEQNKKYISLLEKYSGKIVHVSKVGSIDGKSRTATVYTKRFYEILKNLGFGEDAKTKTVPPWAFECEESIRLSFIDGFYNADGWEFTDQWAKHYAIELCNKELIYGLKRLLQLSNIKTSVPHEKTFDDIIEICGIECNRSSSSYFYYYLDGKQKSQMEKYNFINSEDFFLEPIRKIEARDEEETFDIQVDSINSNFIANGIVVHNSMVESARRVWKQLCMHENTEIWTNTGYKKIKDMRKGDIVYSYDYDKCQLISANVKEWAKTGDKPTFELKTKHRVLHLTETHDILTRNNSGVYEYKKIKDLINCDFEKYSLVLPTVDSNKDDHTILLNPEEYYVHLNNRGIEYILKNIETPGIINRIKNLIGNAHPYKQVHAFFKGKKSIPYNIFLLLKSSFGLNDELILFHLKKSKKDTITNNKFEFTFTPELVRFFGFMLGDGWTTQAGIGFALSNHLDINRRYIDTINNLHLKYSICYPKNNSTHPGWIIVYSKEIKMLMKKAGFITGFKNKVIPDWIFTLSLDTKKEFIKGLFDADGSWKWGIIGLSNKTLITQLKHLCQQSGIMCNEVKTCREVEEIDEFGVIRQPTYKLYINFNQTYDLCFEKILSIQPYENSSAVYDIQVDNDLHNFVANGIVVHNSLMEDAMLIHRIMRAPEKRMFYVDVGNIPPSEIDAAMQKVISQVKKVPYIDERTGDYNLRFNLNNMIEDFYLPVRGSDSGTRIDTLPGMEFTGIDDLEYVKNKMMAALKIPKAFLGYEEGLSGKCIRGNTKISLLDGRKLEIKDIAKLYENGNNPKLETYSYDAKTNSIVPGKIIDCKKTRLNAELVRVHLDNGTHVDTTPDHGFILKGGEKREAKDLVSGDSLQAIYRRTKKLAHNANEYEQIYQPNIEKWTWTHKMVDEYNNGKIIDNGYIGESFNRKSLVIVHHDDFNRFNNSSKNLINNIAKLSKSIGYHTTILREVIENSDYTASEFLNEKIGFASGRSKSVRDASKVFNHKVVSVEVLQDKEDTYNLEVWDKNENHNYLIDNGIVIKNSTLAAEDVRFARTISRIQRIIISELTKIAIVHLFVQGYQDASLVDFELELSNPSTIFEQEKIEIWTNKVSVANDMMEAKLFSKKWIYNQVFNMSDDDIETLGQDIIKDRKEFWRMEQISEEGNDPSTSNQKMGEGGPEDLGGGGGMEEPDLGGKGGGLKDLGDGGGGGGGLPELEETKEIKGPALEEETRKEREQGIRLPQDGNKAKYTSTHTKTFGEDPLGDKENKEKSKSSRRTRHIYRNSPLALEEDLKNIKLTLKARYSNNNKSVLIEEKSMLNESNLIQKTEQFNDTGSMMDESNLIQGDNQT